LLVLSQVEISPEAPLRGVITRNSRIKPKPEIPTVQKFRRRRRCGCYHLQLLPAREAGIHL
jgi:hypothetical protein